MDSKLAGTDCAEYARRFPNEHMKAEYTPGQARVGTLIVYIFIYVFIYVCNSFSFSL